MDGAAQFDLALDVDQHAAAEPGGGRDTGWLCKGEPAKLEHRQAVDLPHLLAAGIDVQYPAQNGLVRALAQTVGTMDLCCDRLFHILPRHDLALALLRPVIGFAHQVGQALHVGGKLFRIFSATRAVLDDACHSAAIERQQLLPARQSGDQARIEQIVLIAARHLVLEIGRHLEQFAELRVVFGQQVIQHAVAQQHYLDLEGNRLRFQRYGADQAVHLPQRFDTDLARRQGALERLPGKRLGQQLDGIQHQIAAIGLMHCAGLDQHEIGDQRPQLRGVLHPADQVLVSGVLLVDDRRAPLPVVIDQQVDPETGEVGRFRHGQQIRRRRLLLRMAKIVHVLDDILLYLVQVGQHRRKLGIVLTQRIDEVAHGKQHRFFIELAHFLDAFATQALHLMDRLFQHFLQHGGIALDPFALILWQLGVLVRADDFAILGRREGKTVGGTQQGDFPLGGGIAHFGECLGLALAEIVVDLAQAATVFITFEHGRDGCAQFAHQLLHIVAQFDSGACRQSDHARFVRLREIVDVAPVARWRSLAGALLEQVLHQRALATAGRAHHVQVVSLAAHADAELCCIGGTQLPDDLGKVFKLGCGIEGELVGIAMPVKLIR